MNKDEAIEKIRNLLSFNSEQVLNFLDVTDKDGNVLRVASEELAIGDEIKIVDEAGIETLIPDAEYTLEDGRLIKTDSDSKVSEIIDAPIEPFVEEVTAEVLSEVETPVIETPVEDTEEDVSIDEATDVTDVTESRISQLEELVKELISKQASIVDATMSVVNELEKFGAQPVEDIKIQLKSDIKNTNSKSIVDRNLEAIREMRNKNKK